MTLPTRSSGGYPTSAWFNSIKAELEAAGVGVAYVSKNSDYSLTLSENVIGLDGGSNTVTITLPDATYNTGRQYALVAEDTTNTLTIDTDGGNINGSSSYTFSEDDEVISVVSDGTNWRVKSRWFHDLNDTYFEPVTKKLSSDITSTTSDITDLQFTNLIYGKTYLLTGIVQLATTHDPNFTTYALFTPRSSAWGGHAYYQIAQYLTDVKISYCMCKIFSAQATTLYMKTDLAQGTLKGDGTEATTSVTLQLWRQ